MKRLKEFAAFEKYPFASEAIRKEVASYVDMVDHTIQSIYSDPTLTKEAKIVKAYKEGVKHTEKIAEAIKKSIDIREKEIHRMRGQLKSQQLRQKPLTSAESALVNVVYQEIKNGELDLKHAENEKLLKIGLALADSGLIEDFSDAIDQKFSPEALQAIKDHQELLSFEWDLIRTLREYEINGLNEAEALELDAMRYKGE